MNASSRLESAREAEAEAAGDWYRSPLALLAGAIVFAAILAAIVVAVGGDDDDDSETSAVATAPTLSFGGGPEVDDVIVTGDPLPPFVPGEADPAIGMFAPDTRATSLANGDQVILDGGRGRVIGFFAHWCPHCQRELPELTDWLSQNTLPPNTEFVAVSTSVSAQEDNYPPSAWFNAESWPAPVVVDDAAGTLLRTYGFSGFPAFIAVDATGVVIARASGNIGADGVAEMFDNFAS